MLPSPRSLAAAALALAAAAASPAASALEPFASYDTFSAPLIDPDLWFGNTERVKAVQNGVLRMLARDYADTTGDTGSISTSFNHAFAVPVTITEFRATVNVRSTVATGCSSSAVPTQARVRLMGSFFNAGTPVAGSQVGDVTAQIRLTRQSNSIDPPGVLRADAVVQQCLDAACGTTLSLGSLQLGTADAGQPVRLQIQWDQPGSRFLVQKGSDAPGVLPYTVSDGAPPSLAYKHLKISNTVPNCTTSPRPSAMVDAEFDNVAVNRSALPR